MLFNKSFGTDEKPVIILLHGGGLSNWSLEKVAQLLEADYHVITPIIEGHGENAFEPFISIENSAARLIEYIEKYHNRRVFALGGLSLGAQIIVQALSQKGSITQFAIIESSLVYPIKGAGFFAAPTYGLFFGLIRQKWFSKLQAKSLLLPDDMFEKYYADSIKMSKKSLINITVSNSSYSLKSTIADSTAKTLIITGEKELGIMKKSAQALHQTIKHSVLYMAPNMKHGELSIKHPQQYTQLLRRFFTDTLA